MRRHHSRVAAATDPQLPGVSRPEFVKRLLNSIARARAIGAVLATCAVIAPAIAGASARTVQPAAPASAQAAIASSVGVERTADRFARKRNRQATPEASAANGGSDAVLQDVGGQAVEAVDRIVGMPAPPTATPTPAVDLAATAAAATEAGRAAEATRSANATATAAAKRQAEAMAQAVATARSQALREGMTAAGATATAEAAATATAAARATANADATAQAEATRAAEATVRAVAARAATATAQANATATAQAKAAASATAAAEATRAARDAAATATALALPRTTASGVVDSVGRDAIGVRPPDRSGPPVVYHVAQNARIVRNATTAALTAIVPGDVVELRLDATNQARIVTANPGPNPMLAAARDWWWTGFAPLFLLGLIWRARTREPFLLMAAPAKGREEGRGDAR